MAVWRGKEGISVAVPMATVVVAVVVGEAVAANGGSGCFDCVTELQRVEAAMANRTLRGEPTSGG